MTYLSTKILEKDSPNQTESSAFVKSPFSDSSDDDEFIYSSMTFFMLQL